MAYLVPFHLALPPGEQVTYRAFILPDEPDIPNDTYQFHEWYCPNPDCSCFEALLYVSASQQKDWVAQIRVPLQPHGPIPPFLEPKVTHAPYAQALLKLLADNLRDDPAYLQRLRNHYHLVKTVAANPAHPAHPALIEWANTGGKKPVQKRRRKWD